MYVFVYYCSIMNPWIVVEVTVNIVKTPQFSITQEFLIFRCEMEFDIFKVILSHLKHIA